MKSITLLALLAVMTALQADAIDSYSCIRPMKPVKFTSNQEVDRYNRDVQNYKVCIDRFISQHKENIDQSTKAINKAVAEWNNFVNMNNSKKMIDTYSPKGQPGGSEGAPHNEGYNDPNVFSTNIQF